MRFIYVLLFILLTGAALFSFRKLQRGELGREAGLCRFAKRRAGVQTPAGWRPDL